MKKDKWRDCYQNRLSNRHLLAVQLIGLDSRRLNVKIITNVLYITRHEAVSRRAYRRPNVIRIS
jgi:hypothetical protein